MQIVRVESRAAAERCGPFFLPGPSEYWEKPVQLFVYWVLTLAAPVCLQPVKKKYQIVLFLVDRCAVIAYCIYTR